MVASAEPVRELALMVPDGAGGSRVSWEYFLEPLSAHRTRLIVRGRVSRRWLDAAAPGAPAPRGPIIIERVYGMLARMPRPAMLAVARLGHRVMLARHLRGIKRRAEA